MKECDAVQFPLHRDERARGRALHAPRRAPAGLCTQDIMDIGRMWYHYPFVIELRKKWEARELERVPAARCPASVPAPCPKAHPSTPKCTLMVRAWSEHGPSMVRAWSEHGPMVVRWWSEGCPSMVRWSEDRERTFDLAHCSDADVVTEIELYDEKNKMHPLPVALSRARFC